MSSEVSRVSAWWKCLLQVSIESIYCKRLGQVSSEQSQLLVQPLIICYFKTYVKHSFNTYFEYSFNYSMCYVVLLFVRSNVLQIHMFYYVFAHKCRKSNGFIVRSLEHFEQH